MKKLVIAIAILVGHTAAHAQGSGSALVDAGTPPASLAPAGTPVVVIDATHPLDSAGNVWKVITEQGWAWGGLVVLLAVGTFLAKKNDETHWIHSSYLISGTTALLSVLGGVLNAHFGSASWGSVLPLLLAGVALMWKKPEPKAT